jgi:hypothetical protein
VAHKASSTLPHRREQDLLVRELSDETLVYDLKSDQAHCLNQTAAAVWRGCDGQTTVAELAMILHRDCNVRANDQVVWLALRQLQRAGLLQARVRRPADLIRVSRRDLIRHLGVAAAVPVVMTILAPEARAQASDQCTGRPAPCSTSFRCPGTLTCADRGGMTCSCG